MKIRTLEIENYKSHKKKTIFFQDFSILIGANGFGKTAILEILDLIPQQGIEIEGIEEQ